MFFETQRVELNRDNARVAEARIAGAQVDSLVVASIVLVFATIFIIVSV